MGLRQGPVESLGMNHEFWCNKRVFLTGHTGFKGGWLALWLADLGAKVYGYALSPPTKPNFYTVCDLQARIENDTIADVRDSGTLLQAIQAARPDIVIHLAAQSLVRHSYAAPVETYSINVIGTVNLLEAVRIVPSIKAVVNVTTDKCYENREWIWPYRENEALGGYDPYSSSKACSELVTAAYRRAFLEPVGIYIATARAGNVIGGGDWARDRLIPDFLRALDAGQSLTIRFPRAIRPWQHVLESLSGYLMLAERLYTEGQDYAEGWNFGPDETDSRPVQWIVEHLCSQVPGTTWQIDPECHLHEANILKLDISKARSKLSWYPRWNLQIALSRTLAWHQSWKQGDNMVARSLEQIHEYQAARLR